MCKGIALLGASLVACCVMLVPQTILASEEGLQNGQAEFVNIEITNSGGTPQTALLDDNTSSGVSLQEGDTLILSAETDAEGLYITWDKYPQGGYTLEQNGTVHEQNTGFFQEYLPLSFVAEEPITLEVFGEGKPTEIQMLGTGALPNEVHAWQPPAQRADILVMPTHADDEHLFFGAVMPTYLDRGDVTVQVAYMVNHSTEPYRQQELLNGLWEAGVTHYPIIPSFPDQYSDSLEHAKTIYNEEEIITYIEGLFEQFTPQVVVGHDLNGEYGHGAHILYAESLLKAAQQSNSPPQKIYLHLYGENEMIMEVNTPLERFEGRTAFEVAEDAFGHHHSQQTYFTVEQDGPYDLRLFGLAFSLVEPDTGNDMMQHIVPYAVQEEMAAEEEAERLAAESAAEQSAATQSELPPMPNSTLVAEADLTASQNLYVILVVCISALVLAVLIVLFALYKKNKR